MHSNGQERKPAQHARPGQRLQHPGLPPKRAPTVELQCQRRAQDDPFGQKRQLKPRSLQDRLLQGRGRDGAGQQLGPDHHRHRADARSQSRLSRVRTEPDDHRRAAQRRRQLHSRRQPSNDQVDALLE